MKEKPKSGHRVKLLEYLGNPDNEFPTREFLSTKVLGYKSPTQIYRLFSPSELQTIEREALDIRRTKYTKESVKVDKNLIQQAQESDNPAWAKLYFQKVEGWSDKIKVDVSATGIEGVIADVLKEIQKKAEGLPGLPSERED